MRDAVYYKPLSTGLSILDIHANRCHMGLALSIISAEQTSMEIGVLSSRGRASLENPPHLTGNDRTRRILRVNDVSESYVVAQQHT